MRARRRAFKAAGVLAAVLVLSSAGVWVYLRASLPCLDGEVAGAGLTAPVSISRDALGVPTIVAANRNDLAYATGFLHAQDRFFQMDLLRRAAAGELAALFGPAALPIDSFHRLHRFRWRAEATLAALAPKDRALLERYAAGVNDGLASLGARPFEYALLRTAPVPWQPADSLLVGWAMYFDLQGNVWRKLTRAWLLANTTPEQLAFLLPPSSPWDAPLDAPGIEGNPAPVPASAPGWYGKPSAHAALGADEAVGSSNWAIAGSRSEHGGAIVANDMHLSLQLPATWYRAVLVTRGGNGAERRLVGVTLPGLPAMVAGSNGRVAWGFTNSYGDYFDLVALARDPGDAFRFRVGDGWQPIRRVEERIAVKGAPDETLSIFETPLGPVWDVGGRSYAMHWIAHQPGAISLGLLAFETAPDVRALLDAANRAGLPAQNIVAGDVDGHIGWSIAGPLPDRHWRAEDGFAYPSTAEATLGWRDLRVPADYPRLVDPPGGQLWTANARQLAGPSYDLLGDGGADLGARAQQIRDDLRRLGKTDERGAFGVELDDRAIFLAAWRDRALAALTDAAVAGNPERAEFRRLLQDGWTGRADVGSVGYRLAHDYMEALYRQLFGSLDALLAEKFGPEANFRRGGNARWAYVLGRLNDEKPKGWLPAGKADWQAVELAAVDQVIAWAAGHPLAEEAWGARNRARIMHPFARLIPVLAPWLAAPAEPLGGDANMPRIAQPSFGQSERLVVAPGHEDLGIFNLPGGQSGHPLSPYFLAGYEDWVQGRPTPLLPGPAEHMLTLVPAKTNQQ